MRLSLGYPPRQAERALLQGEGLRPDGLSSAFGPEDLLELQARCERQHCSAALLDYVLDLLDRSRHQPAQGHPLSPGPVWPWWPPPAPGRCWRAATM